MNSQFGSAFHLDMKDSSAMLFALAKRWSSAVGSKWGSAQDAMLVDFAEAEKVDKSHGLGEMMHQTCHSQVFITSNVIFFYKLCQCELTSVTEYQNQRECSSHGYLKGG